jgi:hypothetical protein
VKCRRAVRTHVSDFSYECMSRVNLAVSTSLISKPIVLVRSEYDLKIAD